LKVRSTFKTSLSIWGITISNQIGAAIVHQAKIADGGIGAASPSNFGYLRRNKGIVGTGLGHSAMAIKIVGRWTKDYEVGACP